MNLWSLWVRLANWVVGPPPGHGEETLQIARQRQLSMAVPFPTLDWKNESEALKNLHDYAVALANSVIDWYNRKRHWKKWWSIILRFLIFLFAIVGILIPLLHILCANWIANIIKWLCPEQAGEPTGLVAEAALVLIGISAGFNLIDRLAGFSSGWTRYMGSSTRANKALMEFELDWNWAMRYGGAGAPQQPDSSVDPEMRKIAEGSFPPSVLSVLPSGGRDMDPIKMVWDLCHVLLVIIDQETNEWVVEFKNSISHLNEHVPGFGRPAGKGS